MFNIISYQENANQNYEIALHTQYIGQSQLITVNNKCCQEHGEMSTLKYF